MTRGGVDRTSKDYRGVATLPYSGTVRITRSSRQGRAAGGVQAECGRMGYIAQAVAERHAARVAYIYRAGQRRMFNSSAIASHSHKQI